jgi:hypothetical protein
VQIGGGDQVYCDSLFELSSLQPWLKEDDPHVSGLQQLLCASLMGAARQGWMHGTGSHVTCWMHAQVQV